MSKAVSFNPKRDIPYAGAFIQAAQFALAGAILLGDKGWFFGGLLGILVSVSMVYAASQYADIAQKRKPLAMAGMIILGIFSPVIVGTSAFLEFTRIPDPIWRGVVATAWGLLPDVAISLAGFTAGKGMVKADEPTKSEPETKPERKSIKKAPVSAAPMIACKYGCGFERATQAAMNPHLGACKNNPANMPVRVDLGA